jgi:molybdopterin converting factor small subunit
MRIQVEYFAVLREHVGRGAEVCDTAARTIGDLYRELDARHGFPAVGRLKVAVNDEFRDWDTLLADGDHVVFIPPVAGG